MRYLMRDPDEHYKQLTDVHPVTSLFYILFDCILFKNAHEKRFCLRVDSHKKNSHSHNFGANVQSPHNTRCYVRRKSCTHGLRVVRLAVVYGTEFDSPNLLGPVLLFFVAITVRKHLITSRSLIKGVL